MLREKQIPRKAKAPEKAKKSKKKKRITEMLRKKQITEILREKQIVTPINIISNCIKELFMLVIA